MITDAEAMVKMAVGFVGTPYVWGGKNIMTGADCSGFTQEILSEPGFRLMKRRPVKNAHDQWLHFKDRQVPSPYTGCLVFYGSGEKISHVMICMDERWCVGAQGGGPSIDSTPRAFKHKAMVRIMPITYRHDIVGYVDPFRTSYG